MKLKLENRIIYPSERSLFPKSNFRETKTDEVKDICIKLFEYQLYTYTISVTKDLTIVFFYSHC